MNNDTLKAKARALRASLQQHLARDPAAGQLLRELDDLIGRAEAGSLDAPVQWRDIPGRYLFTEQGLQQYRELEQAYAEFCIEATGGESPALRKLRERMGG